MTGSRPTEWETLVRGEGQPVTIFAHGLAGGIADSRPLGSGVAGRKVFYTARGHDGRAVDAFGYTELAADLRTVADEHSANRALGISMGAGALCALLASTPDRFERLVFFLPAVLDVPRSNAAASTLAQLDTDDPEEIGRRVLAGLPPTVRDTPAGRGYAANRAKVLSLPSMRGVASRLAAEVAVDDRAALRRVSAPALVLGCQDDPAHPADVARQLADALGNATLHIYDRPDVVWTQRADLRARIGGFLSA